MKQYLKTLLPRLSQFSESLDNISMFQDKTWTYFDFDNTLVRYIFKRDKELIISKNGNVTIAKWDFISASNFLLIKSAEKNLLLNHNYIDKGVMVLQIDGTSEKFILMDEKIIPDLCLESYLKKVFYKKNKVKFLKIDDDLVLEIVNGQNNSNYIGLECLVNTEPAEDGYFQEQNTGRAYRIENSRISRITTPRLYQTKDGIDIVIDQLRFNNISVGDFVFDTSLRPIPDRKYTLSFFKSIIVEDSTIIGIKGL